ncbi:MAG: M28 family peptidase [Imperialibacter sp.]|uniref:M28 family peptidase n=1 Tax=Imperialibacter sp. TaxID=2038411 RepID=UPI0032EC7870
MQVRAKIITHSKAYTLICLLLFCGLMSNGQVSVDSTRLMNALKALSSQEMAGRLSGTNGISRARIFIKNNFNYAGLHELESNWFIPFDMKAKNYPSQGVNVVGFLKGESDSAVVVTAHYDHLGVKNREIYYGADDNASGVSVLLEAAWLFAAKKTTPKYTIIFAALDAEETGLLGGYALVEYLQKANIPVKLNLNMDMVSKGFNNELYVCGTYHYPQLKSLIDTDGSRYAKVQLKLGHDQPGSGHDDWTMSSDHGPFHKQKIPFLYFGVEDHKYYHQPTDTFETTPFSFFYHAAETITGFLSEYLYQ